MATLSGMLMSLKFTLKVPHMEKPLRTVARYKKVAFKSKRSVGQNNNFTTLCVKFYCGHFCKKLVLRLISALFLDFDRIDTLL